MTFETISDAMFAYEAKNQCRVAEVHVSPRVQANIVLQSSVGFAPAVGTSMFLAGADWFVDYALSGKAYRFVEGGRKW